MQKRMIVEKVFPEELKGPLEICNGDQIEAIKYYGSELEDARKKKSA